MSIKAGVVGVGSIGRNHARVMSELATEIQFAAVFDENHDAAAEVAATYGVRAANSLEEFATLVDAATVATMVKQAMPCTTL